MNQTERFYRIIQLLENRRSVTRDQFLEDLEISLATFKRDLEYLRDRFHAPIEYDPASGGYRLNNADEQFALPGLWFNASEVYALLTTEHLLENLQPGLLSPHIEPLKNRVRELLAQTGESTADEVKQRIRILDAGARAIEPACFTAVTQALLRRCRLTITHYNRGRDETTQREVSPQRLVYYRNNWYLDSWCHLRKAIRSFSLDSIAQADVTETPAQAVSDEQLDKAVAAGYGIFAGAGTQTACLRFSAERARWVAAETWHPQQQAEFLPDGRYQLTFPYSDDRELIMDILRHGEHVEVIKPESLRQRLKQSLRAALEIYR